MKKIIYFILTLSSLFCYSQQWEQLGQEILGEEEWMRFGSATAMNATGDIVAVRSEYNGGNVRVFQHNGSSWAQIGQDVNIPYVDGGARHLGNFISINAAGDRFVVNGRENNISVTRVYTYNGSTWEQTGSDFDTVLNTLGNENHYSALNAEGNILAVSSWYADFTSNSQTCVRVFEWNGTDWIQLGSSFCRNMPLYSGGNSGARSVDLSADGYTLAIGDIEIDTNRIGTVNIYRFNGIDWEQHGETLTGVTGHQYGGHHFGMAVKLNNDGNTLAVKSGYSWYSDGFLYHTYVQVYRYSSNYQGSEWTQIGEAIDGDNYITNSISKAFDMNGTGDIIVLGDWDRNGTQDSGRTRIFKNINDSWVLLGEDIPGIALGDRSGFAVSLNNSGNRVAIGAYANDGPGYLYDIGHVRVFEWPLEATQIEVTTIEGEDTEIYLGEELQLITHTTPENAVSEILWSVVSGDEFVSLNNYGRVTGLSIGTATVRASLQDNPEVYDEIEVSVVGLECNDFVIDYFPFTETFESTSATRDCWVNEYGTGNQDWTYEQGIPGSDNITQAWVGELNALFAHEEENNRTRLVSPEFDLSSLTTPMVSFRYANDSGEGQNTLRVYYKADDQTGWRIIPNAIYTTHTGSWTQVTLYLPNPSAGYHIAFDGITTGGNGIAVDNVTVFDGLEVICDLTIVNYPFLETFENNSPTRDCWTNENEVGTTNWQYTAGSLGTSITSAYEGQLNARYYSFFSPAKTKLVSPRFDLSVLTNPALRFYYAQAETDDTFFNTLNIYYKTTEDGEWTLIPDATFDTGVNEWTEVNLYLPESDSDTYYIAFDGETSGNWVDRIGTLIDAIEVYDDIINAESITVITQDNADTVLCEGEILSLQAVVLPEDAESHEVVWDIVSYDLETVSLDEEGFVTALNAGEAVIRATSVTNPTVYGEITITVNPLPVLEIETGFVFCEGTPVELFATSSGNVVFWYNNQDDDEYTYHGNLFTPEITESTTFWVEAYNIITGCTSERIEITVTINPIPDAPIAVEVQYVEEGATLADIDVDATGELTWYADVALTVVLPETTLIEENTTYYVTQTIAGCESEATVINPEFLGLFDVTDSGFAVYPNPTAGILKIQSKVAVANIEVFNISGQKVTSVKAAHEVNLTGYPGGTYIVRITLENGEVLTRKVIKK